MRVSVAEYSPEWARMFEDERAAIEAALVGVAARIEHVGSTSVPGLAAKPVIDIMVGLEDFSRADGLVPKIEALGYEYVQKYEAAMPLRRFFLKDREGVRTHQIHMVGIGTEFWERHLLFRDYLRRNPGVAAEYAALKKELARREWADVNEYADAKTEFIRGVEREARSVQHGAV